MTTFLNVSADIRPIAIQHRSCPAYEQHTTEVGLNKFLRIWNVTTFFVGQFNLSGAWNGWRQSAVSFGFPVNQELRNH